MLLPQFPMPPGGPAQLPVLPVGCVLTFAGQISSGKAGEYETQIEAFGWMICDGRMLEVGQYPELFGVLGYLYGGSDGRFKLPDYRGYFLRGLAHPQSSPPDSIAKGALENRVAAQGGQNNGIGSTQLDALQTHRHSYTMPDNPEGSGGDGPPVINSSTPNSATGNPEITPAQKLSEYETRPCNVFVHYIIRYTYHVLPFIPS